MNGICEKGKLLLAAMREVRPDSDCLLYLAHAILESGWFNRVIGQNNVWGIKANKNWPGLRIAVVTHEKFSEKRDADRCRELHPEFDAPPVWDEVSKRWKVKIRAYFRDWATEKGSAEWYFKLLGLYPAAYYARCPGCFVYGLTHGIRGYKYFTENPDTYERALAKVCQRLISDNVGGECSAEGQR